MDEVEAQDRKQTAVYSVSLHIKKTPEVRPSICSDFLILFGIRPCLQAQREVFKNK